jgi:hypothetical protein
MMIGIALLMALAAPPGCTEATEDVPPMCPSRLPAIKAISIERTGRADTRAEDEALECGKFRPTTAEVRGFLRYAGRVDPRAADATLDRSPCFAAGKVAFMDGSVGAFRIEQYRVGTLRIGKRELLLFCEACQCEPFIW